MADGYPISFKRCGGIITLGESSMLPEPELSIENGLVCSDVCVYVCMYV